MCLLYSFLFAQLVAPQRYRAGHPPGTPVVGFHALKADKPVLISLFSGNGQSSFNHEIKNKFPL